MGVFNVLALSAETSVLGWYFLVPLASPGGHELLARDLHSPLQFRQSLAPQALLSLLRLLFFVYIRRRNKRVPSTRCFVFVVSLLEVVGCCLGSLQPILYLDGRQIDTFSKHRRVRWGGFYVAVLGVMAIFSTLLQLSYILQLNKSRGRLADDNLLRDVMGETPRAKWRSKWATLGKQLAGRHKPKDPTFEAMVRLYAHQEGAVDRLVVSSDRDEAEFEFYLPQLCSFLLLDAFSRSPQLCAMLLRKCSVSHVFAHKMLWYLQSYCLHNPAFATEADYQRVQMLIDDVSERGVAPAMVVACPPSPATSEHQSRANRGSEVSASAQEVEALLPGTQDDHYDTFQENNDLERGLARSAIASKAFIGAGVEPFEVETAFLGSLANISSNLRAVAYNRRNDMLRIWLQDLEAQYLPNNSLYLPVGNSFHRLKHVHVDESFTFSTRERVPFLLCAEVVDYPSPQEERLKRRSNSVFNGRRFTLSLWDSASTQDMTTASTPAERTPLMSPDAAKLGFWSESRTPSSPTRLRSFSHHISNKMVQPTELLHGLIDSLVGKTPGGKNLDPKSVALLSKVDDECGEDVPKRFRELPERSQSQPFFKSEASIKPGLTVDTSASGLRPTLSAQTVPASIVPVTTDIDDMDSVSSVSGAWSPKSDTVMSPRSETSAASPHHLARFDSTDRFLQDLSERDSKLEEEEAEANDPSSESRNQAVGEPLVIFKERWAEKERRIQAISPYGKLPGWRLLPVIVKSDDDLRQEQLALQLIHQFAKVFEEFQVPVFIRPYDVIAISATSGLVEAISDTISIDSLKRNDREFTTLLDFFTRHFGDPSTPEFHKARANFVSSMAGYAIVCYLLQIKDRHNGNILLDAEGHIIHIDFGFILSNNPGNMAFEQAPFKLTADFVELMGGPRSAHFRRFRSLCVRSFLVARKYRHRFVLLVEMMLHGNEHLPCFAGDPKGTVERLAARFQPDLDINSCEDFVHELIDASLDNWRTRWYDKYQRWIVGVF
ncbi:phosphatidylinositol kinase (PIK-J) [Phytophthora infestans T30-4]|uniref:1-phosphatidylinositol 4-kinase n=1 Tax=Phytophthora infestans (strain T30-4) TaxID=403677 RepID=D0NMS3_PHYIT|nr:phosphatidylinositol kinase (PIK-J) [Phytophthora infestans T30-4]EEY61830.1 phosphatidylinositol kinase (PIK-J) [Phytophthora infestans T30-4]|eukprot:XP_002899470.1 phosphatidylinositol kinase (PIK-J) [Phytophthora infestans T30-4]